MDGLSAELTPRRAGVCARLEGRVGDASLPRVAGRLAAGALLLALAVVGGACAAAPSLKHARDTPREVAEAVLAGLDSDNVEALQSVAVDEEEFRLLVWPRLPAARPERNLTWQYVWRDLSTKSAYHRRARTSAWQASGARVVDVRFNGPLEDHGAYRIYRVTDVALLWPDGRRTTERLFGSMIEQNGRYKVFSYIVD